MSKKKYTKKQLRLAARIYLASVADQSEAVLHFNCTDEDAGVIEEELEKIRDSLLRGRPSFSNTDEILRYVKTI